MRNSLIIAFPLIVTGCGGATAETGHITIVGFIDQTTVSELKHNVGKFDTILITSQGGDIRSSIELGKIIYDNNIKLKVIKYCLSACAQYILPASSQVEYINMPIVALHHSSISLDNFFRIQNIDAKYKNYYTKNRIIEENYFRYINIDTAVATEPLHYLDVKCYSLENSNYPLVGTSWMYYVPSTNTYKRWTNIKQIGVYASTNDEIRSSAFKYIPKNVNISFVVERDANWEPYAKLNVC